MYSFLVKSNNVGLAITPGTVDRQPIQHTVHNSVSDELADVEAAIKPETDYQFFTYKGSKPVEVQFRGKPISISKGTKFGVRKSHSGKDIRLIFPGDKTRVFTLTQDQANRLAKGV
jgi:hypothetical protein